MPVSWWPTVNPQPLNGWHEAGGGGGFVVDDPFHFYGIAGAGAGLCMGFWLLLWPARVLILGLRRIFLDVGRGVSRRSVD